jgi:hypothetical protein
MILILYDVLLPYSIKYVLSTTLDFTTILNGQFASEIKFPIHRLQ